MTNDQPAKPGRLDRWRNRYREAGLSVILVLLAILIFVVSPLAGVGRLGAEPIEILRFALAATAILIVSRSRLIAAAVAATFVISLLNAVFLRHGVVGQAAYVVNIGITMAFDLAVAWTVAHGAFDPGRITVHRIMGAVILYLYIGLIFASLYRLAHIFLHPSFRGLPPGRRNLSELLYFSLSTLTTTGFGDIAPVHPFVRSLANLEAVIGQLYPATFLARLVTLQGRVTGPGHDTD